MLCVFIWWSVVSAILWSSCEVETPNRFEIIDLKNRIKIKIISDFVCGLWPCFRDLQCVFYFVCGLLVIFVLTFLHRVAFKLFWKLSNSSAFTRGVFLEFWGELLPLKIAIKLVFYIGWDYDNGSLFTKSIRLYNFTKELSLTLNCNN